MHFTRPWQARTSVRTLVALVLAASACVGVVKLPPDFTGAWKLNVEKSTGPRVRKSATALEITQRGDEVKFTYFFGEKQSGSEAFLVDGVERDRYTTRIERAYTRARWDSKYELLITTRHMLDQMGYQTYSETDSWLLSEDKNTLTNKLSDGTVLVYEKDTSAEPLIPPDPLKTVVPFHAVGVITGTAPCRGASFEGTLKGDPVGKGTFSFCGPPPQNWNGKVGSCGVHSGILTFNKDGGGSSLKMMVIGQFCISNAGSTFRGTYEVEKISATGAFMGHVLGGSGDVEFSNTSNTIYLDGVLVQE